MVIQAIKISMWLTILLQIYGVAAASFSDKSAISNSNRNGNRRLADVTDKAGYISIDCGTTKPYQNSGIFYNSDEEYIATGSNMLIDSDFVDFYAVYNTVRSFPEGERNCYTLKPVNGRNHNYLIRAQFMYGNYDGKNSIPSFDIYIGVHHWHTLVLTSVQEKKFIEIVHKPTTDFIYVCLVNTDSGTPFISELVLRPLDDSLYNVSDEFASLSMTTRYNTGLAVEDSGYTSYQDDVYDRFWASIPLNFQSYWETYSVNKDLSSLKNDAYRLPISIFRTGAKPKARSHSMNYFHTPRNPLAEAYYYLHFAETQKLGNNESREFNVFINGNPISKPIKLRYLEALTLASSPVKFGSNYSRTWLSINQTGTSTLPPILNALEVYDLIELPQSATNQDDTNAIMEVKTKYGANGLMKTWQGDPCLPRLPWDGLNCSDNGNDSPRIIYLNLASKDLSGEILPSLFSLKSLNYLNLSNNNLTGNIPEFLADMPSLLFIDLSGNNLDGSVPIRLTDRVKNNSLSLRLEGNPNLCTSDTCRKTGKKHKVLTPVIATAASLLVLLIAIACVVFCMRIRKKKSGFFNRTKSGGIKSKNRKFTYSEVINMTNNFQTIVGRGGFGIVYHGFLNDGTEVAVKILKQLSALSIKSFQTEAELLMRVHHRNLVSLVGYCEEGKTMALIYEYMANGSLQEHLSGEHTSILSWKERIQISIDAAQGLDYLHTGCKPAIVHRDVKPANILLDDKLQAKIADFGISRIFSTESMSHISTETVAGSPGYLDPEYGVSFRLTEKSDVYSFGIILLELVTGRAAITKNDDMVHIVNWVSSLLTRGDIPNIVDRRLQGAFSVNSAWIALEMAMACVSPTGIQRPTMGQVLANLKECLALELAHEKASNRAENEVATSLSGTFETIQVDSEAFSGPKAR